MSTLGPLPSMVSGELMPTAREADKAPYGFYHSLGFLLSGGTENRNMTQSSCLMESGSFPPHGSGSFQEHIKEEGESKLFCGTRTYEKEAQFSTHSRFPSQTP